MTAVLTRRTCGECGAHRATFVCDRCNESIGEGCFVIRYDETICKTCDNAAMGGQF